MLNYVHLVTYLFCLQFAWCRCGCHRTCSLTSPCWMTACYPVKGKFLLIWVRKMSCCLHVGKLHTNSFWPSLKIKVRNCGQTGEEICWNLIWIHQMFQRPVVSPKYSVIKEICWLTDKTAWSLVSLQVDHDCWFHFIVCFTFLGLLLINITLWLIIIIQLQRYLKQKWQFTRL